jgi:hypothetical protein
MKKYIYIITIITMALFVRESYADTPVSDNNYIASKIRFYYFEDATDTTTYIINNKDVINGTVTGDFWTNSDLKEFQSFIKALLSNTGDKSFQYYTRKLIEINNRPIAVLLWNDKVAFTPSSVAFKNQPCQDSNNYVWPCAAHWTTKENNKWGGYMHIGIHHSSTKGLPWLKATFLHELMHTQDKTLDKGNSFVVFGKSYRYGADNVHYYTEATPNKRLAYMEAIADVSPMYLNFKDFEERFKWFSGNGYIVVERTAPSGWAKFLKKYFGADYNDNVWLYEQIKKYPNVGPGSPYPNSNRYMRYKIKELPGKFIVHNELVMAMMMTMTSMHVAEIDPFIWSTKEYNKRIKSNQNQDPFALFVKIFADGMLQDTETVADIKRELDNRTSSTDTVDKPYTFILPLAYSDYFTGYNSKTKDQFKALFNNEMDTNLIDIYWDYFKDRVRGKVTMKASNTLSDMTDIAIACGVNQSYVPGKSGRKYESN